MLHDVVNNILLPTQSPQQEVPPAAPRLEAESGFSLQGPAGRFFQKIRQVEVIRRLRLRGRPGLRRRSPVLQLFHDGAKFFEWRSSYLRWPGGDIIWARDHDRRHQPLPLPWQRGPQLFEQSAVRRDHDDVVSVLAEEFFVEQAQSIIGVFGGFWCFGNWSGKNPHFIRRGGEGAAYVLWYFGKIMFVYVFY